MNPWQIIPTPEQNECVAMACLSKSRYEKEIGHRANRLHVSWLFSMRFVDGFGDGLISEPYNLEIQGMKCDLDGRLRGVACYTRRT